MEGATSYVSTVALMIFGTINSLFAKIGTFRQSHAVRTGLQLVSGLVPKFGALGGSEATEKHPYPQDQKLNRVKYIEHEHDGCKYPQGEVTRRYVCCSVPAPGEGSQRSNEVLPQAMGDNCNHVRELFVAMSSYNWTVVGTDSWTGGQTGLKQVGGQPEFDLCVRPCPTFS
jgi:hypothetical protein